MPTKIRIPQYAKQSAKQGLFERKSNGAGLSIKQAQSLGIFSGVQRARQLIKNKFLKEKDAKAVARFYNRFRNKKTPRVETALKLWGGRRFGKLMNDIYFKP